MKLLALAEGADHVCYRYRLAAFEPALARAGWQLECMPLAKNSLARVRQLCHARQADAVVLQRKLLPWWQLRFLRKHARLLIFDLDDAVFHRDSFHRKGTQSWQRMARFWATVYASDIVLAGNEFLRRQVAALTDAAKAFWFPTCVVPQRYPLARHQRCGTLRLVWIGQRSTVPSLYAAHGQLSAAAAACGELAGATLAAAKERCVELEQPDGGSGAAMELRVVSDVFPKLAGLRVIERPWSASGEAAEVAAADVGISWLPGDDWSRGKCGLKVLQYMAAGLPVVANRVGVHTEMIIHGKTGFLADTPPEWAAAMARLAGDAELRAAMGAAARRRVEALYSVAAWEESFVRWLDPCARGARRDPCAPVARLERAA